LGLRILVHPGAARELSRLPLPARREIARLIESLAESPRPAGAEKMTGLDALRIRCGEYRIIYSILSVESLLVILKVGDRRDVYRHLDTIRARLRK
jgi:mRNA interferase RelE/StbE